MRRTWEASLHVSPGVVTIAQDIGFPRAFATERNTRRIAEGGKVLGELRNKRARGILVRYAGSSLAAGE